ncbi:hypothetical protein KPH14_011995 [Odynerus spinipes]|uniref:DDE-1 domain-containing protein n=1 Tax=Odynerus spinipes TaxID=1348599 RepID=A0AAD9RJ13_9HYME|nr:hypothetical protein KPH14_011995 [Odynerus spinipes]
MFIDNCPAHPKNVELRNIKLIFLLPNATSKLQPMDQGIIKVLKQGYRTRLVHRYLTEMENHDSKRPWKVHNAILYIAAAWGAMKSTTTQNCFKKSGFDCTEICQNSIAEEAEPEVLLYFPGYSSIDDNVSTSEMRSVEELIEDDNNTTLEATTEDDIDAEESVPILSNAQALTAVNDLRRYVSSLGNSEDGLQQLNLIENIIIHNASKSLSQTKINDFFKRN